MRLKLSLCRLGSYPFGDKSGTAHSNKGMSRSVNYIDLKQYSLFMRRQANTSKVTDKYERSATLPIHRTVDISTLKQFVSKNYPSGSPLQVVLVEEADILSTEAFLAKMPIWLKLSHFTSGKY